MLIGNKTAYDRGMADSYYSRAMTPTTEELKAALLHADYMEAINETLARSIRLLAQAELSRREKVKAAKCVCGIKGRNDAPICAGPFEQYFGTPNEYCGNRNINGYLCGHDRACHGGENERR
jgi:hypothetical protein